jgi:hypothetical protein
MGAGFNKDCRPSVFSSSPLLFNRMGHSSKTANASGFDIWHGEMELYEAGSRFCRVVPASNNLPEPGVNHSPEQQSNWEISTPWLPCR